MGKSISFSIWLVYEQINNRSYVIICSTSSLRWCFYRIDLLSVNVVLFSPKYIFIWSFKCGKVWINFTYSASQSSTDCDGVLPDDKLTSRVVTERHPVEASTIMALLVVAHMIYKNGINIKLGIFASYRSLKRLVTDSWSKLRKFTALSGHVLSCIAYIQYKKRHFGTKKTKSYYLNRWALGRNSRLFTSFA